MMRWASYIACIEDLWNDYKIVNKKPDRKKQHLRDLCADMRINVKLIKKSEWCNMDSYASEQDPVAGSHECGNEHLGSIKFGEFLI
jgi:hypothetical protein